jgi:5'-phosphate synthase pdxT subunit
MRIGVLALQGDFLEHIEMLRRLGAEAVEVRLPGELSGLDGLIVPGGESTTIGKMAVAYGLVEPLRDLAAAGRALWGTCAGLILLAREAVDGMPGQPLLGLLDIAVVRNGFGRQVDSFEADLDVPRLGPPPFRGIFIRAPYVKACGPAVEVLARLEAGAPLALPSFSRADAGSGDRCVGDDLSANGAIVAVQQGRVLGTAFHPELTPTAFHPEATADERFHRYFLDLAAR